MKLLEFISQSSSDTYENLGEWIPIACLLVLAIHPIFWAGNQYFGESEPTIARCIAILSLLPYVFNTQLASQQVKKHLKKFLFLTMAVSGPGFLLSGILIELSVESPDIQIILRRQYEFAGATIACLLLSSSVLAISIVLLAVYLLVWVLMESFLQLDYSVFAASWVAMTSAYLFFITAILIAAKASTEKTRHKAEALASAGSLIAHELRTPLLTMRSYSRSIASSKSTPNQYRELANRIEREVTSANTLIDMFLANAAGDNREERPREFDYGKLITEACHRFPYKSEAEENSTRLSLEEEISIVGPRTKLLHVFFNLLKNALDNASSTRAPIIEITLRREHSEAICIFRDNGNGIHRTNLGKIFDPFYTNKEAFGTGIGLAFVHSVVSEGFKGAIECNSEFGRFAEFSITIPLSTRSANAEPRQNQSG